MKIYVIAPIIESQGITQEEAQRRLAPLMEPDVEIVSVFLDYGPSSIENEIDDALAVPNLLEKAMTAASEGGADGIVVDCMCDPGVAVLRSALVIPVVGPAETSFHLAATLGHKFSVVDIGSDTAAMVTAQVARFGLARAFASVRGTSIAVEAIGENAEHTFQALGDAALKAVRDDGADVIVLGCTGFTGCAKTVREYLGSHGFDVPVIDPLPLTIRTLIALVREGQSHSKRAFATPAPAGKSLRGFKLPQFYKVLAKEDEKT